MPKNQSDTPPVRKPEANGARVEQRDLADADGTQSPAHPRTSGAADTSGDPLRNPVANRDPAGPRKAGATPRPTDKPIG